MPSDSDELPRYVISVTQSALQDLENIYEYVKNNLYDLAAYRQESLVISRIRQLKIFPNGNPPYEPVPPLRSIRAGKYRIFFLVDEETKTVKIVRILHSSQDLDPELKGTF